MKLINAEEYDKQLEAFQLKLMEEAAQYADSSYASDKRRKLKGVAYARAILRNMESVDAEPVRHGRWIRRNNPMYSPFDCEGYEFLYVCSRCGAIDAALYPYCHCGARMDEVTE